MGRVAITLGKVYGYETTRRRAAAGVNLDRACRVRATHRRGAAAAQCGAAAS